MSITIGEQRQYIMRSWTLAAATVAALMLPYQLRAQGGDEKAIEEKAQVCAACHGQEGAPVLDSPAPVPIIWGQNLGYLLFQLRDFKSGARRSDEMAAVVDALDQADLVALAQYFAQKAWPAKLRPVQGGDGGDSARLLAPCSGCHQAAFVGDGGQPRLAGQSRAYLEKAMRDFRTGARANNPGMTASMRSLDESEISALAAFLAGL